MTYPKIIIHIQKKESMIAQQKSNIGVHTHKTEIHDGGLLTFFRIADTIETSDHDG